MYTAINVSIRTISFTVLSGFLMLLVGGSKVWAEVDMVVANAVFEGGGVKGIGLVGALTEVERAGFRFRAVAGTSAGSIVAALYAAGYTSQELKSILERTDFSKLLDPAWPQFIHFFLEFGVYKGNKMYEWIYSLLETKGVITFEDLKEIDLKIVASDLTNKEILVFDVKQTPNLKVAEAVRMSIGIPLFFDAYKYGDKLVVDGGILSNYPVGLFSATSQPTIGFKLVSAQGMKKPRRPNSFMEYVEALAGTIVEAHDKEDERRANGTHTIHIPTGTIAATQFDLTDKEKEMLFESGRHAALRFLYERAGGTQR